MVGGGHGFRMLEFTVFLLIRLFYRDYFIADYVIADNVITDYVIADLSVLFPVHLCTNLKLSVG